MCGYSWMEWMYGISYLEKKGIMDELRLLELASHIKNETARGNWLTFMRSVEMEGVNFECSEDYDDGIEIVMVSDLKTKEKARFSNISNPFEESQLIIEPTGINSRGQFGMTRLHQAVEAEDISLVRELLEQGADKSIQDTSGHTPRDIAAQLCNIELIQLLQ